MFNFTGSAIVSTGCTVTGRSRKPLSATIRAVSNFCVLAAARTWSAFFSYNILPLFASTTITEAAVVFGIPSALSVSLAVTAFAFRTGPETPLGRTASGSTPSCAQAPSAETRTNAQRIQIRLRNFMSGELATEILFVQASKSLGMQQLRSRAALYQFDLVAFWRIDESDFAGTG